MKHAAFLQQLANGGTPLEHFRCHLRVTRQSGCNAPRRLQNHLLIFLESGRLEIRYDHQTCILKPGHMIWLPTGTYRQLIWPEGTTRTVDYRLHIVFKDNGLSAGPFDIPQIRQDLWCVTHAMQTLVSCTDFKRPGDNWRSQAAMLKLFTEFIHGESITGSPRLQLSSSQRQAAIRFIQEHLTEGIRVEDVAKHLELTTDYFSRAFCGAFDVCPRKFIKEQRVRLGASLLLETHDSIKQIAATCGYSSSNLFRRQFRQVFDQSPMIYRQSN